MSTPEPEKCWNCGRSVIDTTDTPFCDWCPLHTASGAIHYLQQACEELYAHVPYRIADDVKEKATAVIDFLNAKEAAPKGEEKNSVSGASDCSQIVIPKDIQLMLAEIWARRRDNFRELGNEEWRGQYARDVDALFSIIKTRSSDTTAEYLRLCRECWKKMDDERGITRGKINERSNFK